MRNVFANNLLTNIKLSRAQILKIIQSDGSFGSWLANLDKKAVINFTILSGRDYLPRLVSNLISNTANILGRKIKGTGTIKAGNRFSLFMSN